MCVPSLLDFLEQLRRHRLAACAATSARAPSTLVGLPQQHDDSLVSPARQLDAAAQRRAWIAAGAGPTPPVAARRAARRAAPALPLRPRNSQSVAGPGVLLPSHVEERHALAEVGAARVAREQRAAWSRSCSVIRWTARRARAGRRAPIRRTVTIARRRACALRLREPQDRHLDRAHRRHELGQRRLRCPCDACSKRL